MGPFAAVRQSLHLDTPLLELQNTKKIYGTKNNCVDVQLEQILDQKSCLTLKPMDCNLPASSVHGIFQARILEWVAIPFSRVSLQLRNRTQGLPRNLLKCPMRGVTNFLPTLLKVLMSDGNHTNQQILFLILLPLSYPLL